jgi:ABC-type sulfate/molybdate transport systems ATPase subunit
MMSALDVAVTRRIGEFELDVAFTVESGISVLFGPSGAGKSLTLALIAGLLRPDTGTIEINGRVMTDCARRLYVSTQERRIGMVFQDGLLLPHRSVLDNVALAVRQASGRRARRAVALSWLERAGAQELCDRRPSSLSGGQRQRVALARALAIEPRMLLLDEPFGALDAKVRKELRVWLRHIHDQAGVTSVFVTHDQDEAFAIADLVAVMHAGRIEQYGTPADVRRDPRTKFVSEFLSA